MKQLADLIQVRTSSGRPVTVAGTTVTPQSRALTIRTPFGGFVWIRPTAILVERDGRVVRLAIPDRTRMMILAILGIALALTLVGLLGTSGRKELR